MKKIFLIIIVVLIIALIIAGFAAAWKLTKKAEPLPEKTDLIRVDSP